MKVIYTDGYKPPCFVYRVFGRRKKLLYVGCSIKLEERLRDHAKCQRWWNEARVVIAEPYKSVRSARSAEVKAIRFEGPTRNVLHNRGRDAVLKIAKEVRRG